LRTGGSTAVVCGRPCPALATDRFCDRPPWPPTCRRGLFSRCSFRVRLSCKNRFNRVCSYLLHQLAGIRNALQTLLSVCTSKLAQNENIAQNISITHCIKFYSFSQTIISMLTICIFVFHKFFCILSMLYYKFNSNYWFCNRCTQTPSEAVPNFLIRIDLTDIGFRIIGTWLPMVGAEQDEHRIDGSCVVLSPLRGHAPSARPS